MANIAFMVVFLAGPVFALWRFKSVTWTMVVSFLTLSFVGAFVQVSTAFGTRWTMTSLQWALVVATLILVLVAVFGRNLRAVPRRTQLWSLMLPSAVVLTFLIISRSMASAAGPFADVGYFVLNRSAEDNADWLDYAARLAGGGVVDHYPILGGPLQLLLVFTATIATCLSLVAYGGINQVMVATDSVLYCQFLLASLAPLAVAPVAERSLALRRDSTTKNAIPAVAVWSGALVLTVLSVGAMGLGHLTMQFSMVTVTLWFGAFWVSFPMPRIRVATTAIFAVTALVWFPLAPLALVALAAYGLKWTVDLVRGRGIDWVSVLVWASAVLLVAQPLRRALMFIFLTTSTALPTLVTLSPVTGRLGSAARFPGLILLDSQGGTEVVGPVLGVLAAAAAIAGALVVVRQDFVRAGWSRYTPFLPMGLLLGYGLAIATLGTWFAGNGPNYGALKTTMLAAASGLAVALPVALAPLVSVDSRGSDSQPRVGSPLTVVAFAAVSFLLVVDGVLPRAMVRINPDQWRSTYETIGEDRAGYWWPAEVQPTANQPVANNPIACLYFPPGEAQPAAGPDGQLTYSCSRVLMGLAGEDQEGQPVVDWLRREWLTNTPAWTDEWLNMRDMPRDVLARQVILLNDKNQVVGMETLETLLDRHRPQWAIGQPLYEAQP